MNNNHKILAKELIQKDEIEIKQAQELKISEDDDNRRKNCERI